MKKFVFPLERVLHLRQAQARIEEAKLERLYGERTAIETQERSLRDQRQRSEGEIRGRGETNSAELSALDAFQHHVQVEVQRSQQARTVCEHRIQAQLQVVSGKRREVKLVEKLKLQRQNTWNIDLNREITQQAEESHLAKWNRENIK
jgi:flagellar biosynthesis chaperone FliJ